MTSVFVYSGHESIYKNRVAVAANSIIFAFFIIFAGAAVLATLALLTRQSIIVAYIAVGALLGPAGFQLLNQTHIVSEISEIGIMFLLFLLGLNMQPKNLIATMSRSLVATIACVLLIAVVIMLACRLFAIDWLDSLLIGTAMTFSSTIIGLKLLPSSELYHRYSGRLMVSILLLQDILAIIVLMILDMVGGSNHVTTTTHVIKILLGAPLMIAFSYLMQRYLLEKLFARFIKMREYLLLLAIGWCLGIAQLSYWLGLSHTIGAFIAGVTLAAGNPVVQSLGENLKPLRDFFLVIFFFTIGAALNWQALPHIVWPVLLITALVVFLKPLGYRLFLGLMQENKKIAWVVGWRLGQASEFSMLIAFLANQVNLLNPDAYLVIQTATILSFVISSYIVVWFYPSPMATKESLRRN